MVIQIIVSTIGGLALLCMGTSLQASEPTRQEAVRERGAEVMPFTIEKVTHVFTPTKTGGTLVVLAKNANDTQQITMIRSHFQDIAAKFAGGDFSGPAHVHSEDMPGLAELRSAKHGELTTHYTEASGGAMVSFFSAKPRIVSALHNWFGAQLADHGTDAIAGHEQSTSP